MAHTDSPDADTGDTALTESTANSDHFNLESDPVTQINHPTAQRRGSDTVIRMGTVNVGSILKGRFIIDREIARGGMGVVYRARDIRKEQFQDRNPYIAIKVLGEECKAHPNSLIALQREAGKAQKLAHPNIVTVYDFDSDGDTVFMTMEYLEGESLERLFSKNGSSKLPVKKAMAILEAMSQGLAYAHQKGIVHCDLKPGNIFMTKDDSIKLLDFGIARAVKHPEQIQHDATRFDAGSLGALTPAYASCEMIENKMPDPRDDIYALACVAYEMFSGRHPFNRLQATMARDSQLKPLPIKGLGKQQWKALQHGLAFERKARPASVQQFFAELSGGHKFWLPRGWQAVVGAGLIVLLVAMSTQYIQTNSNDTKSPGVMPATPPESISLAPLSAEQLQTVERLLEAAEIHFMVQRITEPEGSNAFEAYQHILEIAPGNVQAKLGMKKIADHYETLAQETLRQGDMEKTRAHIQAGLNVMPQHTGLIALKEKLEEKSVFTRVSLWFKDLLK